MSARYRIKSSSPGEFYCYGGCRKRVREYTRFGEGCERDVCDRCLGSAPFPVYTYFDVVHGNTTYNYTTYSLAAVTDTPFSGITIPVMSRPEKI